MTRPVGLARRLLPFLAAAALRAGAEEAWPEGYGERWQRKVDGWVWSPDPVLGEENLQSRGADDGTVELRPGQWWFVEAGSFESFRAVPGEGQTPGEDALEAWAVTRGSVDVGPRPEHLGPPPRRAALLAVGLPWIRSDGDLRIELPPGESVDWIAVRCVAKQVAAYRFAVDAYERMPSHESWERVERVARRDDLPAWPVPSDPETLPGHDTGRFLRSQRVLLPWAPAQDSAAERRLRAAAWCASDLLSRVPVREHAHSSEWKDSSLPIWRDRLGRPWMRTAGIAHEVEGPMVLRILARHAWRALDASPSRGLSLTVRVDNVVGRLAGWPGADLEATSDAWNDEDEPSPGRPYAERWILAAQREIRVPVPPGRRKIRIECADTAYLLVQELRPIEQVEHRSPFRDLPRFPGADLRSAACESVALELLGLHRDALDLVSRFGPPEGIRQTPDPALDWFLWRRLALATLLEDTAAADEVAARLVRRLPVIASDLAAEVRVSLLRHAVRSLRDGMAAQVAQWIFDDPPAEPEDFTEALSAWCTGRRAFERMRAYPFTAEPRTLRRFLRDVEAASIREVFGTWADLGTVGATAGGRRWLVPIEPQVDRTVLRGDAYSAWLNLRSLSGAGPWHVSRAEDLDAIVLGEGSLQMIPAADWIPAIPLDLAVRSSELDPLGRVRFRDPHAIATVSLPPAAPASRLAARPVGAAQRVYLWRGQNILFGEATRRESFTAAFETSPRAVRETSDTPEGWGLLTDLFPLQGPPGGPVTIDFRGEDYRRTGIARYRFAVSRLGTDTLQDLDVPFRLWVGGQALPLRRLLWIAEAVQDPRETGAESPPVESYSAGPIVTGFVLLAPGPALVRLEAPRGVKAWGSVAELDIGQTPPELLLERGARASHVMPPSGLWMGPKGVTGDPAEAAEVAAATLAVEAAADPVERARRLEERARVLFRMGRSRMVKDFEEAEVLFPQGGEESDRVKMALAVLAFRAGDDLELRGRVEAMLRRGSKSRELFLLAAAAALGMDEPEAARSWLTLARAQPEDGSVDLERIVCVALGAEAPSGQAQDVLLEIMTALLRLRRMDPVREAGPEMQRIAALCESEAKAAAAVFLHGRGARFAAWGLEARLLASYAGTQDWPPPRGVLAAFSRERDLRNEEVIRTPPRVRLDGRFGAWQVAWMTEGEELVLELPGPELYEFEWRSAHAMRDGLPLREAAPARLLVSGLPGPGARAVVAGKPADTVRCERIPWAVPSDADSWLSLAPAGKSPVRVKLQKGAGFLSVRRVSGPTWMSWDARSGPAEAPTPFPPPLPAELILPDPAAGLVEDIDRRLNDTRKAPGSPEALTVLADDALFAVLTRAEGAPPEWVVRALDLYLKAHDDGLGNAHWQAHHDLARLLTRWSNVDVSDQLPEFRRVRIPQDLPDDPALAVSNALFHPFPDDVASTLFDHEDVVEWHHRSAEPTEMLIEVVAESDPRSADPVGVGVEVDGKPVPMEPLEAGKRRILRAGLSREALVTLRIASPNPGTRVHARARLLLDTPAGPVPVRPERRGLLFRAPAGRVEFVVRGPTLARLETWDAADLGATPDPAEWTALPAPISRTILAGVPRAGAAKAVFELKEEKFVRLSVRTVDADALARAVPPPAPAGDIAADAVAPPAPDLRPEPPGPTGEDWQLVEYPGTLEIYAEGYLRDPGSRNFSREEAERDELRWGGRVHWKPFEHPLFLRLTFREIKESGTNLLNSGQLRVHHYVADRPDVDWRLDLDNHWQYTGDWEQSYTADLRLRWRVSFDEQWLMILKGHYNHWWSTMEEPFEDRALPYPILLTDYRLDHRRWIELEARLRHTPFQNVVIETFAGTRSNDRLRPWEPDRWTYGVEARAHYEEFFLELSAGRTIRVDDDDRGRRGSERRVGITMAYETWLGRGTWLSAEAGFTWSPDDHSREGWAALVLRFGARSGLRLDHVDPEHTRFHAWQQSRYPWRR